MVPIKPCDALDGALRLISWESSNLIDFSLFLIELARLPMHRSPHSKRISKGLRAVKRLALRPNHHFLS